MISDFCEGRSGGRGAGAGKAGYHSIPLHTEIEMLGLDYGGHFKGGLWQILLMNDFSSVSQLNLLN